MSQSIESAVRSLRSLPPEVHPRVVVLSMMSNVGGCYGEDGNAAGPSDYHTRRIAQFRDEGFPTLVVGVRLHSDGHPLDLPVVSAYAAAGGLARHGPAEWYDITHDRDELTSEAERVIVQPAYCELRTTAGAGDPDGWSMDAAPLGIIPRDQTHRDGWDWEDTLSGKLRLYGSACERVARARIRPRLVTSTWGCYPPA